MKSFFTSPFFIAIDVLVVIVVLAGSAFWYYYILPGSRSGEFATSTPIVTGDPFAPVSINYGSNGYVVNVPFFSSHSSSPVPQPNNNSNTTPPAPQNIITITDNPFSPVTVQSDSNGYSVNIPLAPPTPPPDTGGDGSISGSQTGGGGTTGTTAPLNGIYLVADIANGDTLAGGTNRDFSDAMANHYINGAFLKDGWSNIETADGTYDWSALDTQVKLAEAAGKKVALGIQAGTETPNWVYTEGAKPFHTLSTESNGYFCQPNNVPIPWDPIYLAKWTAFIAAFGAHYANDPKLAEVKITGIDQTTSETNMPNSPANTQTDKKGPKKGQVCTFPDDNANWIAAGYTQAKVFTAWKQMAGAFATAFPNQALTTMTSIESFPWIGANGQIDSTGASASFASYNFLPYGAATFGKRFTAAQNGWRPNHLDAGVLSFAKTTGNPFGWQPSWPIDCYENGKNVAQGTGDCTESSAVHQLFQVGLASNPTYLEVLLPISGTNNYNDLIQQAYTQVMGQ